MACTGNCTLCGTLRAKCRCLDRPKVLRTVCHAHFAVAALYVQETRFFGKDAATIALKLIADAKQLASKEYFAGRLQGFNVLSRIERDAEHLEGRVKARLFGTAQKMKDREAAGGNSPSVKQSHDDGLALMLRLFPTAQH